MLARRFALCIGLFAAAALVFIAFQPEAPLPGDGAKQVAPAPDGGANASRALSVLRGAEPEPVDRLAVADGTHERAAQVALAPAPARMERGDAARVVMLELRDRDGLALAGLDVTLEMLDPERHGAAPREVGMTTDELGRIECELNTAQRRAGLRVEPQLWSKEPRVRQLGPVQLEQGFVRVTIEEHGAWRVSIEDEYGTPVGGACAVALRTKPKFLRGTRADMAARRLPGSAFHFRPMRAGELIHVDRGLADQMLYLERDADSEEFLAPPVGSLSAPAPLALTPERPGTRLTGRGFGVPEGWTCTGAEMQVSGAMPRRLRPAEQTSKRTASAARPGEFEFELPGSGSVELIAQVLVTWSPPQADDSSTGARAPLELFVHLDPPLRTPGVHELGELPVAQVPFLCSGRVLGPTGAALEGVLVVLIEESDETAQNNRLPISGQSHAGLFSVSYSYRALDGSQASVVKRASTNARGEFWFHGRLRGERPRVEVAGRQASPSGGVSSRSVVPGAVDLDLVAGERQTSRAQFHVTR